MSTMLAILKRELFRPGWWVCCWKSRSGQTSGSMAVFGPTIEKAFADAKSFLSRVASGEIVVTIRPANIFERIGAACRALHREVAK